MLIFVPQHMLSLLSTMFSRRSEHVLEFIRMDDRDIYQSAKRLIDLYGPDAIDRLPINGPVAVRESGRLVLPPMLLRLRLATDELWIADLAEWAGCVPASYVFVT